MSQMNISIAVPNKRVEDLLFGHLGRSSDWLHSVTGTLGDGVHVHFDREEDAEGAGKGHARVNYAGIQRGLASMALGAPAQFAQWLAENDDDITFDVAWQYIVFDKLVYA